MHHDPSDLGSKIRIRIFPNERTLRVQFQLKRTKSPVVYRDALELGVENCHKTSSEIASQRKVTLNSLRSEIEAKAIVFVPGSTEKS